MLNNLANLIKVKTLVTLFVTFVFCWLSLTGAISPEQVMDVFKLVIVFYFGTQAGKTAN